MRTVFSKVLWVTSAVVGALCAGALRAQDVPKFVQTNLVSDIDDLARITDPQLVNPWGVSHSRTSPFWVSNQGKNTATLYTVIDETNVSKVNINPPKGFVAIPTTATGPQGPTGQVNNTNPQCFPVGNGGNGNSAAFIFANLNGTISAWNGGATAFIQAMGTTGTVYTGLAINGGQSRLYAANDSIGRIDVYDCSFAPLILSGAFVDPSLPKGLVPFNVQGIGGDVYVTYAPAGRPAQIAADLGQGVVAIFDEDGNFIKELVSGSRLAAPWGITIAPASFRHFGGDVLVGNFSFKHSEINAFILSSGKLDGTIPIKTGGLPPGGLWTIEFGIGNNNGRPDVLYFADGIDNERHGLFGAIE